MSYLVLTWTTDDIIQSSPFDACDRTGTHQPLRLMTLIIWDIGTKKMKEQKHQI